MKDFGTVHGNGEQAKPLIVGATTVYVHTDIQPVEEINGEPVTDMFSYHEVQYGKDEYIELLSKQNDELNGLMNTILGV